MSGKVKGDVGTAAVHEAGHALVALACGYRVDGVSIGGLVRLRRKPRVHVPPDSAGVCWREHDPDAPISEMSVAVAGLAAEEATTNDEPQIIEVLRVSGASLAAYVIEDDDDISRAAICAREAVVGNASWLALLLRRYDAVLRYIRRNRSLHGRIAEALRTRGELDRGELQDLELTRGSVPQMRARDRAVPAPLYGFARG